MKKISPILTLLVLFCCAHPEQAKEDTYAQDTIRVELPPPAQKEGLKNVIINDAYFISQIKSGRILGDKEIEEFNLNMIDDINRDYAAEIKVVDTLFKDARQTIVVISREGKAEQSAYWVQLDKSNRAFAFETIYYNDTEQYLSTTTAQISNDQLIITTEARVEADPTTEKVTLRFVNGNLKKESADIKQ